MTNCKQTEKDGVKTRTVKCETGLCCGAGFKKGDEENLKREQIEFCYSETAATATYTETWDAIPRELGF